MDQIVKSFFQRIEVEHILCAFQRSHLEQLFGLFTGPSNSVNDVMCPICSRVTVDKQSPKIDFWCAQTARISKQTKKYDSYVTVH